MKQHLIKILLVISLLLSSCGGEDLPPLENNRHTRTSITEDTATQVMSSTQVTENSFKLSTTKVSIISPLQRFPYNSNSAKHTMEAQFNSDNSIDINIVENGFQWANKFTIEGEPNGTWLVDGMLYEINTKDKFGESVLITVKLFNTDDVKWMKIKNRTYTKAAASNKSATGIKYMDNHQIEVQRGQTLRILVDAYNSDPANTVKVTISEICKKNNLGSKCTVHIGQMLNF